MMGCEPQAKQFWAQKKKKKNRERRSFIFFSLPFSFKYHFNQSFDNYETCQLIVRIHQMCHKWQEMRTRILKLDGLQKSLTITAINHPGTSISGWRRFCRQQKWKTKTHAEKGCHTLDGKEWHSTWGLSVKENDVKKDAVVWGLWQQMPPATVTIMDVHGGLHLNSKKHRGHSQPSNLLGIPAGSAKRMSACSSQVTHTPLSVHDALRTQLRWVRTGREAGVATVFISSESQAEGSGYYYFYVFRVGGILLTNIKKSNNL